MRINNDFIIVGVDAGYGNMKTANTIYPTGLAAMDTKPYFDGNIYVLQRQVVPHR